jgi:hypothetical protein
MKTKENTKKIWETFLDACYYDLWRVRRKNERGFDDGFHLHSGDEAKALVQLLNKMEHKLSKQNVLLNFKDVTSVREFSNMIEHLIMVDDFETAIDELGKLRDNLRFWGWSKKRKDYTPTGKK